MRDGSISQNNNKAVAKTFEASAAKTFDTGAAKTIEVNNENVGKKLYYESGYLKKAFIQNNKKVYNNKSKSPST